MRSVEVVAVLLPVVKAAAKDGKHPVLRKKQKRVGSRPRLWLRCTSQGFSPSFLVVRFLGVVLWFFCGFPCVLCAVCCERCGVVSRSNKTTLLLFISGLEVYKLIALFDSDLIRKSQFSRHCA